MPKHESKICQRCEASFECKVGDIANCQCSVVSISEDTAEYLSKTNYDCLCQKCLSELNIIMEQSQLQKFSKQKANLIEGKHYYLENGFLVFTELYHIQRGHCCESGCRHCAYGFQK